jgi:nitronate monooxygenase
MIPGGFDFAPKSAQLEAVSKHLTEARAVLGLQGDKDTTLPVGVGFILTHPSVTHFAATAIPVLQQHKPRAVWLFAPDLERTVEGQPVQAHVAGVLRRHGFVVIVQVGTVSAARQAVQDGADVVVAQGMDAGGHQFAAGASVISLVPEIRSMLDEEFPDSEVTVVAAGGIVDGRGVAAALALGQSHGSAQLEVSGLTA